MGSFGKICLFAVTILAVIFLASGIPWFSGKLNAKELISRNPSKICAVDQYLNFAVSNLPLIQGLKRTRGSLANDNYKNQLERNFRGENLKFTRIEPKKNLLFFHRYITSEGIEKTTNDGRIFYETQIKRILRGWISFLVNNQVKKDLAYFSKNENESPNQTEIYKIDDVILTPEREREEESYSIQNVGHSTMLIQVSGLNILTDPVFGHLNIFVYPQKTKSRPRIRELPRIHVILISHNHRDHVDKTSLRKLLEDQKKRHLSEPLVLVPLGDRLKFLKKFWYTHVIEVDWYNKINLNGTSFISIPANHRSGRKGYDNFWSLVTGWIINPENEDVIFKYSGDTAPLSDENQRAVDAVLWNEIEKHKTMNRKDSEVTEVSKDPEWAPNSEIPSIKTMKQKTKIPRIILLEPSGPNFTQQDMIVTHQSASYSALLKLVEAQNLARLSGVPFDCVLEHMITVMIHHNKYELGPDRFNEGIFVVVKLISYLHANLTGADLTELEMKEEKLSKPNVDKKAVESRTLPTIWLLLTLLPEKSSLLTHSHDFVVRNIIDINRKFTDTYNFFGNKQKVSHLSHHEMKKTIIDKTLFPKIGHRLYEFRSGHNNFQEAKRLIDPSSTAYNGTDGYIV